MNSIVKYVCKCGTEVINFKDVFVIHNGIMMCYSCYKELVKLRGNQ